MNKDALDDDSPEHHRRRSEFIRSLVQRPDSGPALRGSASISRTIVQFWHNLEELPDDIEKCIASWKIWSMKGFVHHLFDEQTAKRFIADSLSHRHVQAFERCYHPAMQADYFRLCYLLAEGGFYVDADDVYIGGNIESLFGDSRLKLQPLCYDISSGCMIKPSVFLSSGAWNSNWIFYFNNNPIIVSPGHPIIERVLSQATIRLELSESNKLPEIQATTGPGILSKSIFDLGSILGVDIESNLVVLRDWESVAISQWPLSHRGDSRNWRLSNQKKFVSEGKEVR